MTRFAIAVAVAMIFVLVGCGETLNTPTSASVVCGYTFSPSRVAVSSLPQRIVVQVKTVNSCPWVATTTDSWMSIAYQGGGGMGDLILNLDRNQCKSTARTGQIKIKDTSNVLEVYQDGSDLGICP